MCGRTACSLDPGTIIKACSFRSSHGGKFKQPEWKESSAGFEYRPSLNIAPTDVTPVLVSASHFNHLQDEPVIHPMMWGMIPPWHKGDYKAHGLSTNNCRIENMQSSKLYSPSLSQGKRCVVLCEGFYEWQTTQKNTNFKQPYFIYAPQPEGIKIEDVHCWEKGEWSVENGWQGPRLLKMAGLFSSWTSDHSKNEHIYSYSIITMESNSTLAWLHHRMPAILNDDQDVMDWIDYGRVPSSQARGLLRPAANLTWHPVSTVVNNSRNKTDQCNKPVSLNKSKSSPSSKLMANWLKRGVTTQQASKLGSNNEDSDDKPSKSKASKWN